MAERIGVKPAFLPDQAGEEAGVKPMPLAENLNGVAGIIDKMVGPDALRMSPFARAALRLTRIGCDGAGPKQGQKECNQAHRLYVACRRCLVNRTPFHPLL